MTSWVKEGGYEVDFGGGKLIWMESVMLDMDGIVVVAEGVPNEKKEKEAGKGDAEVHGGRHRPREEKKRWWKDGVDVSIHLERSAMEELVADAWFLDP